jgi:hypothetical protein
MEEATGRLQVMRDEHGALRSLATLVWGLVLGRSNEMPSLVVALSPSAELIEGRVNVAGINRVHWGLDWR